MDNRISSRALRRFGAPCVAAFAALAAAPAPADAQPVRPNILVVFDTSTSMLEDRPACGGLATDCDGSPLCSNQGQTSRIFRLKQAIREALVEVGNDEANFGLARFAQRTTPATDRGCFRGHYINAVDTGTLAGCKTSAATEDPEGAFFTPQIAEEVVVVPVTRVLPPAAAADYDPAGGNIAVIHRWLNNIEASNGVQMTDPEIRSGGSKTPLAATLTYARHYFEKHVKPMDPKRQCRKDIVILVTDGVETCGGNAPMAATALRNGRVDVFVVAQTPVGAAAASERQQLNAIARAGSANQRDAVFVDFTNAGETKRALIQIIAEAVPPTEVCNGLDDDCDGEVDELPLPGVGVPCLCTGVVTEAQAGKGMCKKGETICEMGQIICPGPNHSAPPAKRCVGPSAEVCNGLDDNCNAIIDDLPPGGEEGRACSCKDGAPLMTLMTGECRPGRLICKGRDGYQCEGCGEPKQEVCDCKDNNCNGKADEDNPCSGGFVCVECKCQPPCGEGEFPCPPGLFCDRTTMPPICRSARCAGKVCPAGFTCDEGDGQCKDMCANVRCQAPQTCKAGRCVDCYIEGCPADKVCRAGRCIDDPCKGKRCANGYCDENGKCVSLCVPPCAPKDQCIDGQCKPNPCADVHCDSQSEVCDPKTQACVQNQCVFKACGAKACVPLTGECKDDPCAAIKCPECYSCVVLPEGQGTCQLVLACQPDHVKVVPGGGAGCECGQAGTAGRALLPVPLLAGAALALFAARRRRRR
jgi:hypothetical protein